MIRCIYETWCVIVNIVPCAQIKWLMSDEYCLVCLSTVEFFLSLSLFTLSNPLDDQLLDMGPIQRISWQKALVRFVVQPKGLKTCTVKQVGDPCMRQSKNSIKSWKQNHCLCQPTPFYPLQRSFPCSCCSLSQEILLCFQNTHRCMLRADCRGHFRRGREYKHMTVHLVRALIAVQRKVLAFLSHLALRDSRSVQLQVPTPPWSCDLSPT